MFQSHNTNPPVPSNTQTMLRKLLSAVLLLCCAGACQTPSPQRLAGLWGVEKTFGPAVRGELTIDGSQQQWHAQIAGNDVVIARKGNSLQFTLPAEAGEFRGHYDDRAQAIEGEWIQPPGVTLSNRYATPVVFNQIGKNIWRGEVIPNDDHISLYVLIEVAGDGSLSAIIRNPEFGFLQRGSYRVEANKDAIVLSGTRNRNQIKASYDAAADRVVLQLDGAPERARTLELTRRDRNNLAGFSPRVPLQATYSYHVPAATGDGWSAASLSEAGLDEAPIAALIEKILTPDLANNPYNVQSLLIARHGKLVLEEYFYGFTAERPHDTRSAGKTFAPMLLGLARYHGARSIGPESLVYTLFPEYKPFANWDARKAEMRVDDPMSMTAGYDCDEDHSETAPLNEDNMQQQTAQPDWYKFTLDAPMAHDPGGEQAYYCSAELNLVGGIAAKDSGEWLPDLFYDDYARPLGFHTYHLNLQPTGEAYMGGGAYIRPRDQLKLGQLYLNGGMWNGKRIIDEDWVKQSLAIHSKFEDRFGVDHLYGWGWHIHHLRVGDRTYLEYESGGNGGQFVLILPELDMVVGFTGGAYGDFGSWGKWGVQAVPEYIIRAIKK